MNVLLLGVNYGHRSRYWRIMRNGIWMRSRANGLGMDDPENI